MSVTSNLTPSISPLPLDKGHNLFYTGIATGDASGNVVSFDFKAPKLPYEGYLAIDCFTILCTNRATPPLNYVIGLNPVTGLLDEVGLVGIAFFIIQAGALSSTTTENNYDMHFEQYQRPLYLGHMKSSDAVWASLQVNNVNLASYICMLRAKLFLQPRIL